MTTQEKINELYNRIFQKGTLSTDKTVKECLEELGKFKDEQFVFILNNIKVEPNNKENAEIVRGVTEEILTAIKNHLNYINNETNKSISGTLGTD